MANLLRIGVFAGDDLPAGAGLPALIEALGGGLDAVVQTVGGRSPLVTLVFRPLPAEFSTAVKQLAAQRGWLTVGVVTPDEWGKVREFLVTSERYVLPSNGMSDLAAYLANSINVLVWVGQRVPSPIQAAMNKAGIQISTVVVG